MARLQDVTEAVLRGKPAAVSTSMRKEGRPHINDLTSHLMEPEESQEKGGDNETAAEGVRWGPTEK